MSINMILIIVVALVLVAVFGRKVPGVGLFEGILLMTGVALGAAAPFNMLASGADWVRGKMPAFWGAVKSKVGLEAAKNTSGMSQKEYFVSMASLAGGILALSFLKKYVIPLVAGFFLGLMLRISLAYFGISIESLVG